MEWVKRYWIEFIFGAIATGGVEFTRRRMKRLKTEQCALRNGLQSLLRDKIIDKHEKYMERGYCPIYALDSIRQMYASYHDLGGNGTVTKLVEELMELPTSKI